MVRTLVLAAISGAVWGVLGYLLVRDTNMAGGAWAGLLMSPLIGLSVGLLAVRVSPVGVVRQVVFALAAVYVAVALFALAVGLWHVTVGWSVAPEVMRRSTRAWALVDSVLTALLGVTFSGWALLLWPASIANHRLLWSRWGGRERKAGDSHTSHSCR